MFDTLHQLLYVNAVCLIRYIGCYASMKYDWYPKSADMRKYCMLIRYISCYALMLYVCLRYIRCYASMKYVLCAISAAIRQRCMFDTLHPQYILMHCGYISCYTSTLYFCLRFISCLLTVAAEGESNRHALKKLFPQYRYRLKQKLPVCHWYRLTRTIFNVGWTLYIVCVKLR